MPPSNPPKAQSVAEVIPDSEALDDLLKERNLFQLWKASRVIERNKFNNLTSILVGAALMGYCFLSRIDASQLAKISREWSDAGFNFAASILGFLIAGFTISATLNRPELYALMARRRYRVTGLSYLKDQFFRLIRTFIAYMGFASVCLSIKIFGFPHGPVSLAVGLLPDSISETAGLAIARLSFVWLGAHFCFVLLSLHPFIFNVYQLVLTGVRFGIEEEIRRERLAHHEREHSARPNDNVM